MYFVVFLFFCFTLVIYFLQERNRLQPLVFNFLYLIISIFLALYVSNNIFELSRDLPGYIYWADYISKSSFSEMISGKDPFFQIIISILQIVSNNIIFIYFSFILLIFNFKLKFSELFLNRCNSAILTWLIFCQTFILYEVTQIRAGLAIAIASFSITYFLLNPKKNKYILVLLLIAIYIHFSVFVLSLVFLLLYLLKDKILNRLSVILTLIFSIVLGFVFRRFMQDFINLTFSDNSRFEDYLDKNADELSLISVLFFMKLAAILMNLVFWRELNVTKKFILLFSVVGCSIQIVFNFNAVLGLRFSETFILFSLATFIFPLEYNSWNGNLKRIYFLLILILGFMFFYSSTKILN